MSKQDRSRRIMGMIDYPGRLKSAERPPTVAAMSQPIDVDLPHSLGKDEARRRIANNIHKLQEHIPGGAQVHSGWAGDQLNLDVAAMGQSVRATIDVMENKVHLKVLLPGMLGMFSGLIQGALQSKGHALLEDHHKG
jgi:putative polyhydroxyalkanoate system protein